MATSDQFEVIVSFKGRNETLQLFIPATPGDVYQSILAKLDLNPEDANVKVVLKGKRLDANDHSSRLFIMTPKKVPKLLVLATSAKDAQEIAGKRSDPTIRGFAQEEVRTSRLKEASSGKKFWGPSTAQDRQYRFARLESCTWQSFGHRPSESTPHAFKASELLEKLSTDPGVVAIMKERELVVNALGEMDPIDDRLMQKNQQEGGCLLGYNTNHGLRIDIKLRTDDLAAFRPYPELAATLIHELSHNWVGDHNLLFWSNYAQMRAEYLYTHRTLQTTALVGGRTTAQIAGLSKDSLENILESIVQELMGEMMQHGLHPGMIVEGIRKRCEELEVQKVKTLGGQRLGGNDNTSSSSTSNPETTDTATTGTSARDRALAAAEHRARQQERQNKRDQN